MDRLQKAIQTIGITISVQSSGGIKKGKAVFYPIRYQQKSNGSLSYTSEGRTDNGSYFIFTEPSLLDGAEYGDTISDNNNQYILLWTDTYSGKFGNYTKACMKLITNKE